MSLSRRCASFCVTAAVALLAALMFVGSASQTAARADPLGQLDSQLGAEQARQSHLNATIGNLSSLISGLDGQIRLVENRLAGVQEELAADRAQLARVTTELKQQRALVVKLRRRLAFARMVLARQLVSSYEGDQPDLVSVVLTANGFNNLLDEITFLKAAENQQQTTISITRRDKLAADDAAARLAKLETKDRGITRAATVQARALASMNALLQSKQSALARARSAQVLALRASQERANELQSKISHIRAAQAAAAAAAAAAVAAPPAPVGSPSAPSSLGPNGNWAIPWAIVDCESGGQNMPPNTAGASGYYQIIPSTWKLFGGTGPAAYLTSKAEQDAVASRIWNGGAGASDWVCAGIVGIH
jgi:peptidoglycan hydrolase CwlO-like protein